jgi:hypothetical protein
MVRPGYDMLGRIAQVRTRWDKLGQVSICYVSLRHVRSD